MSPANRISVRKEKIFHLIIESLPNWFLFTVVVIEEKKVLNCGCYFPLFRIP